MAKCEGTVGPAVSQSGSSARAAKQKSNPKPRLRLAVDVAVLVSYLLAANPALTGLSTHEYLGLAAFLLMIAHTAQSADRLSGARWGVRRSVRERESCSAPQHWTPARVARTALNGALVLSLAACVLSGVMVSGAVLPALGLYAEGYFFWDPLHAASAKVLLACVLVHVVLCGPALWRAVRRGARPVRQGT